MIRHVKWLYLLAGLLCFLFFYFSDGLIFQVDSGFQSVKELQSSGSDDDIAIFLVGCVCVVTTLFLLFGTSRKYVIGVVIVSVLLQLLSLTLIEVGSVLLTLFVAWDIYLLGTLLIQIVAIFILVRDNVKYGR